MGISYSMPVRNGNYWLVRWKANGKRIGKSLGKRIDAGGSITYEQALALRDALIAKHAAEPGAEELSRSKSLSQYTQEYLEKAAIKLDPKTMAIHRLAAKRLVDFFGDRVKIDSITKEQASNFEHWLITKCTQKNGEPLSVSTVCKNVRTVKRIFESASELGLIHRSNFKHLRSNPPPPSDDGKKLVPEEDVKAVMFQLPMKHATVVALCYYLGLRTSEAIHAKYVDLEFKTFTLTIRPRENKETTKQRVRVVPVSPEMVNVIMTNYNSRVILSPCECHQKKGVWQFGPCGGPDFTDCKDLTIAGLIEDGVKHPSSFTRTFNKAVKVAGVDHFTMKDLRVTRVIEWMRQHGEYRTAKWLGHSPLIQRRHYNRLIDEDYERVTKVTSTQKHGRSQQSGTKSQESKRAMPIDNASRRFLKDSGMGDTGLEPIQSLADSALQAPEGAVLRGLLTL